MLLHMSEEFTDKFKRYQPTNVYQGNKQWLMWFAEFQFDAETLKLSYNENMTNSMLIVDELCQSFV